MIGRIQPEIVSREIVKPSSAIPNHPPIHSLSFFDQLSPRIYIPLVFFYANEACCSTDSRSRLLRKSLSAALCPYYPLAGRIGEDNFSINCNDEGVVFIEAKTSCQLSEILKHPEKENVEALFPDGLHYKDSSLSSPLVVQITFFDCGGMAIALCFSHPVLDTASMCCFVNNWAAMARNSSEKVSPEFNIGSLYPSIELPITKAVEFEQVKCATKRFVFDGSKIAKLKEIMEKENQVQNPTRVEVVTALIYSCTISAARAVSGSKKPTSLHLAVNLRSRISPPLPESSAGNLAGTLPVSTSEESIIDWISLVGEIREAKNKYWNDCVKMSGGQEFTSFILESSRGARESSRGKNQDVYMCSSWCRFPFYETDFGWGKPMWVTSGSLDVIKNVICLMDTRGGDGVEAMVTLEQHEMALFERDELILAFARIDPTCL